MSKRKHGPLSLTRIGAGGRLTIPAEYRRALSLSGEVEVALVQVGDALVIAPYDEAFHAVTQRLEARLYDSGTSVQDLVNAAGEAREQIAREEFDFGDKG